MLIFLYSIVFCQFFKIKKENKTLHSISAPKRKTGMMRQMLRTWDRAEEMCQTTERAAEREPENFEMIDSKATEQERDGWRA